jgi:hypothetical protein
MRTFRHQSRKGATQTLKLRTKSPGRDSACKLVEISALRSVGGANRLSYVGRAKDGTDRCLSELPHTFPRKSMALAPNWHLATQSAPPNPSRRPLQEVDPVGTRSVASMRTRFGSPRDGTTSGSSTSFTRKRTEATLFHRARILVAGVALHSSITHHTRSATTE